MLVLLLTALVIAAGVLGFIVVTNPKSTTAKDVVAVENVAAKDVSTVETAVKKAL